MPEKPEKPTEVETEYVDRPRGNLFGKMLSKHRSAKMSALMDAKQKLFARYKINYRNQKYYKIVEDRVVLPSGKEVIEMRLYQLIDAAVVTMNSDVTTDLSGGINQLKEFQNETGQEVPTARV